MNVSLLMTVESLLEAKIGINPGGLSREALKDRLKERIKAVQVKNLADYVQLLRNSEKEMQELIELTIVPETWFFREMSAFISLTHYVKNVWMIEHIRDRRMHVLSIPCSTGEEPYSIAMTLLDAGLTSRHFIIDGVDVSKKSLSIAREGQYKRNSFRGKNLEFRERYFDKRESIYIIKKTVTESVEFSFGNITNDAFCNSYRSYDIIFCRNLLIYLNKSAQQKLFQTFHKILKEGGILFLGEAEYDMIRHFEFMPIKLAGGFAFVKNSAVISAPKPMRKEEISTPYGNSKPLFTYAKPVKAGSAEKPKKAAGPLKEEHLLHKAKKLADKGLLKEAEELSLSYLSQHGMDAHAYFLLGVLQHAAGNEKNAEEFFNKTLYLDPHHKEALVYLSLLADKSGDARKALHLRQRAKKMDSQKDKK